VVTATKVITLARMAIIYLVFVLKTPLRLCVRLEKQGQDAPLFDLYLTRAIPHLTHL